MPKLWLYVDESNDLQDWWTIWKSGGPVEINELQLTSFVNRKWPVLPSDQPYAGKYRRHRYHIDHWTLEEVNIPIG